MLQALIDEEVRKDTARHRIGEFLDKKGRFRGVAPSREGPQAPSATERTPLSRALAPFHAAHPPKTAFFVDAVQRSRQSHDLRFCVRESQVSHEWRAFLAT